MSIPRLNLLLVTLAFIATPALAQKTKPVITAQSANAGLYDQRTDDAVKSSFRSLASVPVDRILTVDETNKLCSAADVAGKPLDEKTANAIQAINMKAIKWPADGKFLGDWKEGEKIAQSGRGLTWTDEAKMSNGGNCYNCHQIDKKESSFGTIGPSLYNYGKLRGVKDPSSPDSKAINSR